VNERLDHLLAAVVQRMGLAGDHDLDGPVAGQQQPL
jgi:hypothetical protein